MAGGDRRADEGDGTAATIEPTLITGAPRATVPARTQAGPFALLHEIGSGGMGVVYRAESPDGPAAVKVLPLTSSPRLRQRFDREAKIKIQHPNVVEMLGTGVCDDGSPYIAFELLEGHSLDAILAKGPLSPDEAVRIGLAACAGLSAAHQLGVVHRDLKPSNLFVCHDGSVKILDFGIARLHLDAELTATGDVIGTPSYISPEQARGRTDVDARSDVWGLGAVLYHALSGRPPHKAQTVLATLVKVVMDDVAPLAQVMPGTPPQLAEAVDRALRRSPEERWETIDALADAIEGAELLQGNLRIPQAHSGLIATGERRVVAILLAEGVTDLGSLQRAVSARGGVVIPLVGGRAIGLFGGKTWEGDELISAAEAALACRGAAGRMAVASGRAKRAGRSISGEVLEHAEAALAANLAGVAVDPETGRSLSSVFALRERGPGVLEVFREPTLDWSSVEQETPLVGREAELAHVERALRIAFGEGRSFALLVHGPPGIGKSRLRQETVRRLRGAPAGTPIRILSGRAQPSDRRSALGLVKSAIEDRALRSEKSLASPASIDERRAAIVALTEEANLTETDRDVTSFLGELLGVPMPETVELAAAKTDPELMADRLRLAVLDFLEGLAESGPLALMLEDLHWADEASVSVLSELMTRTGDLPFLLFATARSDFLADGASLFSGADRAQIEPQPLLAEDVVRFAEGAFGVRPTEGLARRLAEHTGGNPLFVEQILIELARDGALGDDVSSLPLPLTVEAAVQSRLDHLTPMLKEITKRAAVFERPFTRDELAALDVTDARSAIDALIPRGILIAHGRRRGQGERYLRFRSAVVQNVAYGMIGEDVLVDWHRKAAVHLARIPGGDLGEIASHFERGGEKARAAEFFARAALDAARRGDSTKVLFAADRALSLGAPVETHFALYMAKNDALQFLGKRDEQEAVLDAASSAAPTMADFARVATEMVAWMSRMGRWSEALENAEAAVEAARESGDREVLGLALGRRAVAQVYAGQLDAAETSLAEAESTSTETPNRLWAMLASWRAQLKTAKGDLGGRMTAYRQAVDRFKEVGDIRRAAGNEVNLADAYNRLGEYEKAKVALQNGLEHCRAVGNKPMEGYALLNLGYAHSMLGEIPEALAALDRASTVAHKIREVRLDAIARVYRARALLGRERPGELATAAERLALEAESQRIRPFAVTALVIAAEAARAGGELERARQLALGALALRDELGGIEEDEAEVFLSAAASLALGGENDQADLILARGRARLMDVAAGIEDEALRARFLAVDANARLMGA